MRCYRRLGFDYFFKTRLSESTTLPHMIGITGSLPIFAYTCNEQT